MKTRILILLIFLSTNTFGQLSYMQWKEMVKSNPMLAPKYGQLRDSMFNSSEKEKIMKKLKSIFNNTKDASDYLVNRGLLYLNQDDLVTAMHRFNQAYLLDDTNSNVFWGYGTIYSSMGQHDLARQQYQEGLAINPKNDNLLTDYGTTFLADYYMNNDSYPALANKKLDTAIMLMEDAYDINPQNGNTNYKLSICYFNKNNCFKAWKHLKIASLLENANITTAYRQDLRNRCLEPKLDCASMRTGNYTLYYDRIKYSIERKPQYQLEKDHTSNSLIKIKIDWVGECVYNMEFEEAIRIPEGTEYVNLLMRAEIVSIEDKVYTVVVSAIDADLVMVYEMVKTD